MASKLKKKAKELTTQREVAIKGLVKLSDSEEQEVSRRLDTRAQRYGATTRAMTEEIGGPPRNIYLDQDQEYSDELKKVKTRPHNKAARAALTAGKMSAQKGKKVDVRDVYKKLKKKLEKRYPVLKLID